MSPNFLKLSIDLMIVPAIADNAPTSVAPIPAIAPNCVTTPLIGAGSLSNHCTSPFTALAMSVNKGATDAPIEFLSEVNEFLRLVIAPLSDPSIRFAASLAAPPEFSSFSI